MSLKTFHCVFVLVCMVAADMFGAWGVYHYAQYHDLNFLLLGIASLVASLGIVAYAFWFALKSEQAHL